MATDKSTEEWERIVSDTAICMAEHVKQFITPISLVVSHTQGQHLGTGSYLYHEQSTFLVTNKHVVSHGSGQKLGHQFDGSDHVYYVKGDFIGICAPQDVAVLEIEEAVWSYRSHNAGRIALDRVAKRHNPVKGEILFLCGFSDERSSFYFNHLVSYGTPYAGQEVGLPENEPAAKDEYHFAVDYRPDKAIATGSGVGLPRPPGMSGSLVWDTKRVATLDQETSWTPDQAVVTGMVWGWSSSSACLLATKTEHLLLKGLMLKEFD